MTPRNERLGDMVESTATATSVLPAVQAALGVFGIHVVGIPTEGSAAVLSAVAKFIDAPGQRLRRIEQTFGDALQAIWEQVGRSSDELAADPVFRTAVSRSLSLVARTERAERISLLREALISVGTRRESSEDHIETFIRYIDELSPGHIRVLASVSGAFPNIVEKSSLDDLFQIVGGQLPGVDRATFRQFFRDLEGRGLIQAVDMNDYPEYDTNSLLVSVEGGGYRPPGVTEFGARFVAFISGGKASRCD